MEHFFPPSSGEDQVKSSPKLKHFFPRILVETYAQTHTQVRSQKFAMGGCLGGLGAEPPALKKVALFCKNNLILELF